MVFKEVVIDVFSIFNFISFLIFCFTVNPEFLKAFASFSERQMIRTSFTGDSFFNNLLSFQSYEIDPLCTHITLLHNEVISFI